MKKLIYFFCFFILVQNTSAQVDSAEAMLRNIISEKNEVSRIKKLSDYFLSIPEKDVTKVQEMAQQLLVLAQKLKDKHTEAFARSQIGWGSRNLGNSAKSLEYNLKALQIAEQLNNPELLAIIKHRLGGHYPLQQPTGLNYLKAAYNEVIKSGDDKIKVGIVFGMGRAFYQMKEFDSALFYLHLAEQLILKNKDNAMYTFFALADTYAEMKNPTLALAYYNSAINNAKKSGSAITVSRSYNALAQYYYKANERDSAIHYANKAIEAVQNTPFQGVLQNPAKLLTDIYRNRNNDSAMKYSDIYAMAYEVNNNLRSIRERELLTFEEQLRQKTIADEKLKMEEQRHQNIQYASIAIGIIIFIIVFLLLSRSIVVNERFISFFAVLGFLIFFEYVNLLIHSWLADFTHESPLLMLLALVFIAAFLIELRLRMEQYVKQRLVEKNKAIRLAAAKRTIQKLENKAE